MATTSPLERSSTTKGSNRCGGVAEGQTEEQSDDNKAESRSSMTEENNGRATRPKGADAAKQVTTSCNNKPFRAPVRRPKGVNLAPAKGGQQGCKPKFDD